MPLSLDMIIDAEQRQSQQRDQKRFVVGCQEQHRWRYCARLASMVKGQVQKK